MNIVNNIKNFLTEVRAEMQKVTWPTREELIGSTGVVLATMFFLSTFIGIADFVLSYVLAVVMR